jgi:hypothetical protein
LGIGGTGANVTGARPITITTNATTAISGTANVLFNFINNAYVLGSTGLPTSDNATKYVVNMDVVSGTLPTLAGIQLETILASDFQTTPTAANALFFGWNSGSSQWNKVGQSSNNVTSVYNGTGTNILESAVSLNGNTPFVLGTCTGSPDLNCNAITYTWLPTTGTADWTVATNWSPNRVSPQPTDILSFNQGGSSTAINIPTQTVASLQFSNNTTVIYQSAAAITLTVNGPTATPNISIAAGSTLQLGSTGANSITLTYATTASQQGSIAGTLQLNSNTSNNNTFITSAVGTTVVTVASGGAIINNGGVVTGSAATLNFASGSSYTHNMDAGSVPTATWNAASTCTITGTVATAPSNCTGQTFGIFTYNATGQTAASVSLALSTNTVFAGNFTLQSTGASGTNALVLSTSTNTVSFGASAAAPADLLIQAGTLVLNNSVNAGTFNLYGNYNQTGGTLSGGTSTGVQVFNFANNAVYPATKNYTQSAGTVTNTNLITYNVVAGATLTLQNNFANVGTGRTFTNSGYLLCGTNLVTGAGSFTQATTPATLGIGDPNGITTLGNAVGNIQVTTARTYTAGANYIYNGSAAQVTGSGLAANSVNSYRHININIRHLQY